MPKQKVLKTKAILAFCDDNPDLVVDINSPFC